MTEVFTNIYGEEAQISRDGTIAIDDGTVLDAGTYEAALKQVKLMGYR